MTERPHYGNPFVEQQRLVDGDAVVLLDRGIVQVAGVDRLSWLDSLTSQSLTSLRPGGSAESLQLDPQGRIEFVLRAIDDGESTWLLVDDAAAVLSWLERMRFRMRVDLADRSSDYRVVATLGASLPAVESNGVPLEWVDPWVAPPGHSYATAAPHPGASWSYREALLEPAVAESLDRELAGTLALDALRIAAWRPAAVDVDERAIPHEFDWLRSAVDLGKGCYRGQETVAKVHNLGHPPRRLVLLQLDGSSGALPERGDVVIHDGADVGEVRSAARHFELGPIALALVKRRLDALAPVVVRASDGTDMAAAQEVIVPPEAGAAVAVPRIPRLGRR